MDLSGPGNLSFPGKQLCHVLCLPSEKLSTSFEEDPLQNGLGAQESKGSP